MECFVIFDVKFPWKAPVVSDIFTGTQMEHIYSSWLIDVVAVLSFWTWQRKCTDTHALCTRNMRQITHTQRWTATEHVATAVALRYELCNKLYRKYKFKKGSFFPTYRKFNTLAAYCNYQLKLLSADVDFLFSTDSYYEGYRILVEFWEESVISLL